MQQYNSIFKRTNQVSSHEARFRPSQEADVRKVNPAALRRFEAALKPEFK